MSKDKSTPEPPAYVKEAIKIAEELEYSPNVIERLKEVKNKHEIPRILADARKGIIK